MGQLFLPWKRLEAKLKHSWPCRLGILATAVVVGILLFGAIALKWIPQLVNIDGKPTLLLGNIVLLFVSLPAFALLWWFRTLDAFNSNDASELSVYMPLLANADVNIRAFGLVQIVLLKKRKPHLKEQIDSATVDINLEDKNGAQLISAALSEVNLERANLTNVDLTNANLTYANLTLANLRNTRLTLANLTNTRLTNANLTNTRLTNANLTEADLTEADLTNASLTYANLTYANLTGANLMEADLTEADLTEANLTNVRLTDAILHGAIYSVNTHFPSDFDPEAAGMVKNS